MVKVKFVGDNPRSQFGIVTGAFYPFGTQPVLWVDVRDRERLENVQNVE